MNYNKLIETLIETKAHHATVYLSPKEIVRATRKQYGGKFSKQLEITLTIGRPNYKERAFIKDCVTVGEKFPVKKVQLKYLPVKKKK